MGNTNMDLLLGLEVQAGYPPAQNVRTPESKTPEQPHNDSSSISELVAQLQELQLKRSQRFLADPKTHVSILKCRQKHADLLFPEPPEALQDVRKAMSDFKSRRKSAERRPLTRDEKRLYRKYSTQSAALELEYLVTYIPHWQECQTCNP